MPRIEGLRLEYEKVIEKSNY